MESAAIQYDYLYSKTKCKTVKIPVYAGMEYAHGKIISAKMRLVAYDYFMQTFDVRYYTNNHQDWMMTSSVKIKREFKK
jgi:hypothetical protein